MHEFLYNSSRRLFAGSCCFVFFENILFGILHWCNFLLWTAARIYSFSCPFIPCHLYLSASQHAKQQLCHWSFSQSLNTVLYDSQLPPPVLVVYFCWIFKFVRHFRCNRDCYHYSKVHFYLLRYSFRTIFRTCHISLLLCSFVSHLSCLFFL